MLLVDFFLHDTQHSTPMLGIAPVAELRREMEVHVDDLFLSETALLLIPGFALSQFLKSPRSHRRGCCAWNHES